MASASRESPLRLFNRKQSTKNKEGSPEVNRLKSLLKKKVGDDGSASANLASPKKAATPRKELKVKRGGTVKLCTSCVDHNKQLDDNNNAGGEKKKRVTKKNSENQNQDQNAADGNKNTVVEKKAAAKKPREATKKTVTQGEMLDVPSTSSTVPSLAECTAPTNNSNQRKEEAKPKPQRKKSEKSTQQDEPDSSVGKTKNVIKVKAPAPKKTTEKKSDGRDKAPFQNMNVADLVTSTNQGEEMQSSTGKSDGKHKSKNAKNKEFMVHFEENSTIENLNEHGSLANPEKSPVHKEKEPKKKEKNSDATKTNASRPKKTAKTLADVMEKAPFENMNITDLVNSTRQEPTTEMQNASEKSTGNIKQKPHKKINHQTPSSTSTDVCGSSNHPLNSSKNITFNKVVNDSEDIFNDDSLLNYQKGMNTMNFNSSHEAEKVKKKKAARTKQAPKDKSTSSKTKENEVTDNEGNSFNNHDSMDTMLNHVAEVRNSVDGTIAGLNFDISDNPIPLHISASGEINLSTSTTLSLNDMLSLIEGMSMNLDKNTSSTSTIKAYHQKNIENISSHSNIHDDETFAVENLPNDTVGDQSESTANAKKKAMKSRPKAATTSKNASSDGISTITQKDFNTDSTNTASSQNDENSLHEIQQPPAASFERLVIKTEPEEEFDVDSSQNFANPESSAPSGSSRQKSAEPKSKGKKHVKSPVEKSKNSRLPKSSAMESAKKAQKEDVSKKLVMPSPQKSLKKKSKSCKNDETLRENHKSSKTKKEKKRLSKHLKNDLKVAKAMAGISHQLSRITIGTTIGSINELHIGAKFLSESDSSSECSTGCSCGDYTSESNSSGDHCKCWECLLKQSDSDDCSCSDDDSSDESSSAESSSSSSSTSASSSEEDRRPRKKSTAKGKQCVKPTYKEKLRNYCSKYDLRSKDR